MRVYDFSQWFGCGGSDPKQPKQWVHYDSGTQALTGMVDGFVDTRLREFAFDNNRMGADLLRVTAELSLAVLFQGLPRMSVPRCLKNRVHFYEVDNRKEHDQPWDVVMVLRSSPVSLGSAEVAGSGKVANKEVTVQFF